MNMTDIVNSLAKAHDCLSEVLEDETAGNDETREAAIDMTDALNAFWQCWKESGLQWLYSAPPEREAANG